MKKKTVVEGYVIFESKRAGGVMVAVGHNPKAAFPYVTWKAYEHSGFSSFEHGNYFQTHREAMIDFYQRLVEAWEYYTPSKNQRKKPRQNEPPSR